MHFYQLLSWFSVVLTEVYCLFSGFSVVGSRGNRQGLWLCFWVVFDLLYILVVGSCQFLLVHLSDLVFLHPFKNLLPLLLFFSFFGFLPHLVQLNNICVDVVVEILKLKNLLLFESSMLFKHFHDLLTFSSPPGLMNAWLPDWLFFMLYFL